MSRAQQISEAIDSMLLGSASLRDSFLKERSKFRHQSSRVPLSHMIKVSRELVDAGGFDCSTNPFSRPTIGADAEGSYFDPNPHERLAPVFKKHILQETFEGGGKRDKSAGGKKKNFSGFATKKKKADAPEKPNDGGRSNQEKVQQDGQEQDDQDKKMFRQQISTGQQQQSAPQEQMSPQDAMQGGMPPQLPELPKDVRRDPDWEGNRAAKITRGLETYSQKVTDRYSISKDKMSQIGGPRTWSHKLRREQVRSGDIASRQIRNNRTEGGQ